MPNKRIVITGIGPICSAGIGKDQVWKNLLSGRTNIHKEKVTVDDELLVEYFVHKVDGFDVTKFGINRDALDYIKEWKEGEEIVDLNYLLAAVKLGIDDSKLTPHDCETNTSLVLAHENLNLMPLSMKLCQHAYDLLRPKTSGNLSRKEFYDRLYHKFLKTVYDAQTFMGLFHVAKTFNIHNYSLFINNACASGLYALETASQIIKTGKSKAVIVATSDHTDFYKYRWFNDIGLYSPDGKIRPFCKDSNGLVFGDGGAAIVLEDARFAKARKAKVYAEYLGGGFSLEGWKVTTPQIGSESYQNAMQQALNSSKVKKDDIDLLCPHGVGSSPIDYYESKAITDIFGADQTKPFITAFKPYVGHNLGGAALLETIVLLLCIKNNTILPTLNYNNSDPRFNISLVNKTTEKIISLAMKSCCAFAGYNAAAVFKK
jgi:3-oxoacyl-[acyl-carrier-protein] synthase II